MTILKKIQCCWLIIRHKEFYLEVVCSRYKNGKPLMTYCISSEDNLTATRRLIKGLVRLQKMQKDEMKGGVT